MTAAAPPNPNIKKPKRRRRHQLLLIFSVVFLILGVTWFLYWLLWGRFHIYTDDAYVSGNIVTLMPQVSGTITTIYTDDTHLVLEGQPVIKLDPDDMFIALQHARANLALTVRKVRQYYENVKEAQAKVDLVKANLVKAELDLKRRVGLVGEQAVSKELMQHHETTVTTVRAQYDEAQHQLASAQALVENVTLDDHPLIEEAKANFKTAYLNWVRTTLYAPVTGYVAKRSAQVGQQVTPGTALLAIVPLNEVWVDANYKETQLFRLRIGQPVELRADANNFTYHGTVQGLSAGSGNAFALLPPQNATGNWIKIVQRLPVRIIIDPNEIAEHPLQIGLSMHVTVDTRSLEGKALSTLINTQPIYKTPIFSYQLLHADNEINDILKVNGPIIPLKQPIVSLNHLRHALTLAEVNEELGNFMQAPDEHLLAMIDANQGTILRV